MLNHINRFPNSKLYFHLGINLTFTSQKKKKKRSWENWAYTYKKMNQDPYLIPLTKINLKWITDLNVPETMKLLDENLGKKFLDMGFPIDFLAMTPKA